ncbi:MAG: hypothetical protein Q9M91_04285 [Candidatus Dojkabacteria bacterium]|nr:hypothetical protein [Candidatus Dojkabacteria bacterium]MDQ7021031.1 hypothetical protein [Candidatus Dojkabacteria bacterium]
MAENTIELHITNDPSIKESEILTEEGLLDFWAEDINFSWDILSEFFEYIGNNQLDPLQTLKANSNSFLPMVLAIDHLPKDTMYFGIWQRPSKYLGEGDHELILQDRRVLFNSLIKSQARNSTPHLSDVNNIINSPNIGKTLVEKLSQDGIDLYTRYLSFMSDKYQVAQLSDNVINNKFFCGANYATFILTQGIHMVYVLHDDPFSRDNFDSISSCELLTLIFILLNDEYKELHQYINITYGIDKMVVKNEDANYIPTRQSQQST